MKNKKAFTLAEVLITLGVIGVVSAITIPTVINNYKKKQVVTQLKKDYSQFTQALEMSKIDNGDFTGWDYSGDTVYDKSKNFTDKYIAPYLKVIKQCKVNASDDKNTCYFSPTGLNGVKDVIGNMSGYETLILADGSKLVISAENPIYKVIYFDINSSKGPNTLGKDVFPFEFSLKTGRFKPRYAYETVEETIEDKAQGCNKNQNGLACANLIMLQGWEITKDYPW